MLNVKTMNKRQQL